MNVVWAATAPETGWFSGLERHSTVQDLEAHMRALGTGLGQGYLEIRRPDGDLPYLEAMIPRHRAPRSKW
ncbi:hypothetical protein ACFYZ2_16310 [Streptomyces sviceus]|uniref:hypothetical protein n=1 Tax=Streptomyces sviceus TaxID=285530 RepID=UPI003677AEF3